MKKTTRIMLLVLCALLVCGLMPIVSAQAAKGLAFSIVQVSDSEVDGNTIAYGCTTRNIAVGMDGTIYVVYYNSNGIYLSHSLNRGETMSNPVRVSNERYEAEVSVSTNGTVYVAWNPPSGPMVARSIDGGSTFLEPVQAGTVGGGSTVHIATDGNNVYLLERTGCYFYSSTDSGQTFSTHDFVESYAYADVHVNRTTHEVIVQKDNPAVIYYKSSDFGQTFSAQVATGKDVYYSVGTIGTDDSGSYLYIAGNNFASPGGDVNLEKVNLSSGTSASIMVPDSFNSQTRSLSADDYGNVVVGYINYTTNGDGTHNLCFVESNDSGGTFEDPVVVDVGQYACAAVNHTNGDILFAYEKSGQIYLAVYEDYLEGYDLGVSKAALSFQGQLINTCSAYQTVTLSNSGDEALTINSITISGPFTATGTSITTLGTGEKADIQVRFEPAASGTFTGKVEIDVDGAATKRTINLVGVGVDTIPITISEVADVQMKASDGSVDVSFTVTHDTPGFDFSTLRLSATSSDSSIVSQSGFAFSGSDGSYTLTITPEADTDGQCDITIAANDQVFEDTEVFKLTVEGEPEPTPTPVPTITPSPTQTPGENTRTISGTLLDSNGNPKAGYVVELHSTPITTITDSQGRYRFDNVDYSPHTLFVKTPTGQQIASFGLSFEEGDEFKKTMTGEGASITYTRNTVSVDITISMGDDEGSAEISDLSGVENPATGKMQVWWICILMAALALGAAGWAVYKRLSVN